MEFLNKIKYRPWMGYIIVPILLFKIYILEGVLFRLAWMEIQRCYYKVGAWWYRMLYRIFFGKEMRKFNEHD